MNVMILDSGNAIIKAKTASRKTAFPHALKALTEAEYEAILTRAGRSGPPLDYLRVNELALRGRGQRRAARDPHPADRGFPLPPGLLRGLCRRRALAPL